MKKNSGWSFIYVKTSMDSISQQAATKEQAQASQTCAAKTC
jgi:hypothetical protein